MLFSLFKRAFSLLLLFVLVACEVDRPPLPELDTVHEVLWNYPLTEEDHPNEWTHGEPVYWNGQLAFFSSYSVDGNANSWVFVDAETGVKIDSWHTPGFEGPAGYPHLYIPRAFLMDDLLIVESKTNLYAINLTNHRTEWSCTSCGTLANAEASGNKLFFIYDTELRFTPKDSYSPTTVVSVADLSSSYELNQFKILPQSNGDTLVALLFKTGFNTVRTAMYNMSSGQYAWIHTADRLGAYDDPSLSKPFVIGSALYFQTKTYLRAFNRSNGAYLWEVSNYEGFSLPVGSSIYTNNTAGYARVFDTNGNELSQPPNLGEVEEYFRKERVANQLYYTGYDHLYGQTLYGIDLPTASLLFPRKQVISFHKPTGSVAVDPVNGRLFFADEYGIVCVKAPNP